MGVDRIMRKQRLVLFLIVAGFLFIGPGSQIGIGNASPSFRDIAGNWAYPQIRYLINQDLISGYGDGTFRPDRQVTRAEFITIVNRSFRFTAVAPISFKDVNPGQWYYNDIARALAAGYLPAYRDGRIEANRPIPRQEAAYMMAKALNLPTSDRGGSPFWDASSISEPYRDAVTAMADAQYMNGYPDGSFRPLNYVSRAEAVTIICNGLEVQLSSETGYDVRDFGAKGDGSADDTVAIQKAVDQAAVGDGAEVYLPDGIYLINPEISINLRSNVELNLADNAVLKAKPTKEANHEIINITNVDNIEISGGSIIGDRKTRTGKTGEWGHGIKIMGSRNIRISDIAISDCWGDGVYIGSTDLQRYSENVAIEQFTIDNCRRNGITIISGRNVKIIDGVIANTRGTDPQAGLCLEPNNKSEFIQNILIDKLTTISSGGYGILFGFGRYANSPNNISVTINGYTDRNSAKGGLSSYSDYKRPAYNLRITVSN